MRNSGRLDSVEWNGGLERWNGITIFLLRQSIKKIICVVIAQCGG